MAHVVLQLPVGSGLFGSLASLVAVASLLVLVLMVVALVGVAVRSRAEGGIRWPEDLEPEETEVRHGRADEEWKYY